jgi:hypothetical protein
MIFGAVNFRVGLVRVVDYPAGEGQFTVGQMHMINPFTAHQAIW